MTNALLTEKELEKVQDILIEEMGIQREQLTPDAKLVADLGADSLTLVEITIRMEEEFGIVVPDELAERLETVESVYELLGELLRGKSA